MSELPGTQDGQTTANHISRWLVLAVVTMDESGRVALTVVSTLLGLILLTLERSKRLRDPR